MAFTNSVLLVVTLVRPVPQFSSSGTLMTISARGNATLGKRDLSHDDFEGGKYFFDLFDSILERRRDHNEMEQDDEDKDLYLITQDSEEIDMTEDPNIFETMINSNNSRSSEPNDLRTDLYFPETETSSLTIRTHSETITTTSSISTLVPEQSTAIPKQHEKGKIVKINKSRPTNNGWVELWIGPLGVCIQRR